LVPGEQVISGKVRHANFESRTARGRLERGRQPHWQALIPGRAHLGYQVAKGDPQGRWVLRRRIGVDQYRSETIGRADDAGAADGVHILSFEQADAKARGMVNAPAAKRGNLTVHEAMERYLQHIIGRSPQNIRDTATRIRVHILPSLGDLVVAELTTESLRRWLAAMANTPAQSRAARGHPRYRAAPVTEEGMRARRNTSNRVLTILKAALNHAADDGLVGSREPWGRKLKPFSGVDAARVRYLSIAESQRLINAADPDFRPLVHGALQTGARYGELARLEMQDFNPDAGTVFVRKSKSGKARQIILTDEGAAFFRSHCAGRRGDALMFTRNGEPWRKSNQALPIGVASKRAGITPAVNFHALRHTWASHAVMAGVPLMVVARNLGHTDTQMVEKHYGHMAQSFIVDAIRAGAPKYSVELDKTVVPLK
jgi:integrase